MHAHLTNDRTIGDWLSVLMAAERAADAMRAEMDEQHQLLEDGDKSAIEPVQLHETQARVQQRFRKLSEHVTRAHQAAQAVDADLEAVENELRRWREACASLNQQLVIASSL